MKEVVSVKGPASVTYACNSATRHSTARKEGDVCHVIENVRRGWRQSFVGVDLGGDEYDAEMGTTWPLGASFFLDRPCHSGRDGGQQPSYLQENVRPPTLVMVMVMTVTAVMVMVLVGFVESRLTSEIKRWV